MALVLFGSGGIREELDLRESTIHLQHRIVHIIVIYVFCTLLKSYQHQYFILFLKVNQLYNVGNGVLTAPRVLTDLKFYQLFVGESAF